MIIIRFIQLFNAQNTNMFIKISKFVDLDTKMLRATRAIIVDSIKTPQDLSDDKILFHFALKFNRILITAKFYWFL